MRLWFAAVLFTALTQTAAADVRAYNLWARATPPGSTVGVVYGELISDRDDELISISTSAAERAEVHMTSNEGGTMKMRPMTAIALPAEKRISFRSGGMHVMLMGLRAPLKAGETIAVTLRFRDAPELIVSAKVLAPGTSEPAR
jgi:periplasmic copper chaperone A